MRRMATLTDYFLGIGGIIKAEKACMGRGTQPAPKYAFSGQEGLLLLHRQGMRETLCCCCYQFISIHQPDFIILWCYDERTVAFLLHSIYFKGIPSDFYKGCIGAYRTKSQYATSLAYSLSLAYDDDGMSGNNSAINSLQNIFLRNVQRDKHFIHRGYKMSSTLNVSSLKHIFHFFWETIQNWTPSRAPSQSKPVKNGWDFISSAP